MYRPVIIYCLIIVGWMGTVSAVYFKNNREARQANVNYVQPAAQSAAQPATQPAAQSPAQPHVQSTSTPYPYVTYPEYSQTTSSSNPTVTAVTVPSSSTESFFHSLAPYTRTVIEFSTKAGNVLFQAMGIAFIGQTILGIFCSFTPICRSLLSGVRIYLFTALF